MFLKLFWICDLVDLSCFKKLSFLSFVRSFLNLEYSLVCSHFMKSLVFYLLTRVDGQLVIHSATSCPVHLVGSPPVSVFTLDYKGGVCCMSPSSPAGRTNWAPPPAVTVWSWEVDSSHSHNLFDLGVRTSWQDLETWLLRAVRNALNICYSSLILFSGWVDHIFVLRR